MSLSPQAVLCIRSSFSNNKDNMHALLIGVFELVFAHGS